MQAQVKEFIVQIVTMNEWLEVGNIMKKEKDEPRNEQRKSRGTNEKDYHQISTSIKVFLPHHRNLHPI
jgi:hypothetical protein